MGFLRRLFARRPTPKKSPQHAVIVTLRLSDGEFGTQEEGCQIHALTDEMEKAILAANAGEFDGDEFGDGECTLYMYGPDADKLHQAIEPTLLSSAFAQRATLTKRYGKATNLTAKTKTLRYD